MYRETRAILWHSISVVLRPTRRAFLRTILILAIGAAGLALFRGHSSYRISRLNSLSGQETAIWVADRYVPAHTLVKRVMAQTRTYPKAFVPPGTLTAETRLESDNGQPLFMTAIAVPEGQPLTRTLLVDAGQSDSLSNLLRPGKVAASFEVGRAQGVGGWVRPGDTIALFATSAQRARLLFSNVQVLAVDGKRLEPSDRKPQSNENTPVVEGDTSEGLSTSRVLTVLISPLEATALLEAREQGELQVVLRPRGDEWPWPTK